MASRALVLAAAAAVAALPATAEATLTSTPPAAPRAPHALAILRPCPASQLKATIASNTVAGGFHDLRITLTNTGASGCAISGYPAIRLLDELKHPRIVAESFTEKSRMFVIGPDEQAEFRLRIATGDATTPYLTARTLAIIPPGDVVPLLLNVELPVAPTIEVTALAPVATAK